jgi:hypothetical protein
MKLPPKKELTLPPKVESHIEAIEQRSVAEVITESIQVTPVESSLEALLDEWGITEQIKYQVASNDLTRLNDKQKQRICAWYAEQCSLHVSEVAAIEVKGKVFAYVKASGVMRVAREKIQRVDRSEPKLLNSRMVYVECTVTLKDGTVWKDVACRDLTDARSVMACSTAATVRCLRLAVGIPIPGEGE